MFAFICTSHSSFTTSAFSVALLMRPSVCLSAGFKNWTDSHEVWLTDQPQAKEHLIRCGWLFWFSSSHFFPSVSCSSCSRLPPRVLNCLLWQVDISESDVYLSKFSKAKKFITKHLSWENMCARRFRVAVQQVHASSEWTDLEVLK